MTATALRMRQPVDGSRERRRPTSLPAFGLTAEQGHCLVLRQTADGSWWHEFVTHQSRSGKV
jgi:hypothetical protein